MAAAGQPAGRCARAPVPHLSASLCQPHSALPKLRVADVLLVGSWRGEGRGGGRGSIMLVRPAVFRWPTTVADRGHQPRGESGMARSLSATVTPQSALIHLPSCLFPLRARSGRQNIDSLGLGYSSLEMHTVPKLETEEWPSPSL